MVDPLGTTAVNGSAKYSISTPYHNPPNGPEHMARFDFPHAPKMPLRAMIQSNMVTRTTGKPCAFQYNMPGMQREKPELFDRRPKYRHFLPLASRCHVHQTCIICYHHLACVKESSSFKQ